MKTQNHIADSETIPAYLDSLRAEGVFDNASRPIGAIAWNCCKRHFDPPLITPQGFATALITPGADRILIYCINQWLKKTDTPNIKTRLRSLALTYRIGLTPRRHFRIGQYRRFGFGLVFFQLLLWQLFNM